jgi:hypothetical protein
LPWRDVVGNAFVGRGREFVEDLVGRFDALVQLLHVGGGCGDGHSKVKAVIAQIVGTNLFIMRFSLFRRC